MADETQPGSNYEVLVTPCVVTKQFDKCIRVALGSIPLPDGTAYKVKGAFSKAALEQLIADLDAVENPIDLPSPEEIKSNLLYMWGVVTKSGESIQQFSADGTEYPFTAIHIPDLEEFWIVPRRHPDELPWFGLTRKDGFVTKATGTAPIMPLVGLPFPKDEAIWFQYSRRNTFNFSIFAGVLSTLPPHVIQVLGWRVGDRICEIGIEEDGNWQVWKMEPLDLADTL